MAICDDLSMRRAFIAGMVGAGLKSATHAAVIVSRPDHAGAGRFEKPCAPLRNRPTIASRPIPSEQIADAPVMTMRPWFTTQRILLLRASLGGKPTGRLGRRNPPHCVSC
jgi:hypothetical protein